MVGRLNPKARVSSTYFGPDAGTTTVALSGTASIRATARGSAAYATLIAARSSIAAKARGALSGVTALAGHSAIMMKATASFGDAVVALMTSTAIMVRSSANAAGTAALAASTKIATFAKMLPPGSVALAALAFIRLTARAASQGAASLSATSKAMVAGAVGISGAAGLLASTKINITAAGAIFTPIANLTARTAIAAKASAAAVGTAGLSAVTRTTTRARGSFVAIGLLGELLARTAIRTFARAALTLIPRPIASPFAARDARMNASLDKAFGEPFTFDAYMDGAGGVNARRSPDGTRPSFDAIGIWEGPAKNVTPSARGSSSDDMAHGWNASHPSISVTDVRLNWMPRPGDTARRAHDDTVYQITASNSDAMGRTIFHLTSRKRK